MPDRRTRTRLTRQPDEQGAAAVEFALVSVLLFTILFGILQYGYFFFQLSAVEYALDTASRQVELGLVEDCEDWQDLVRNQAGVSAGAQATWAAADPGKVDLDVRRGDLVRVSIIWEPVEIGAGLVPFAGGERATARDVVIDHHGTGLIWTGPGIGCARP